VRVLVFFRVSKIESRIFFQIVKENKENIHQSIIFVNLVWFLSNLKINLLSSLKMIISNSVNKTPANFNKGKLYCAVHLSTCN